MLALAIALAAAAGTSHAQPSTSAAATLQFDKGRALMKDKKYAEACAAFEHSQKLDPQIGTLYNLADCYAQLGKIASAWTTFREVGQRDTKADRKKESNRRAKELEKRLPKLLLRPPASAPGLVVTMNGIDITPLVGTESPVDPAEYTLKATAPGLGTWEATTQVTDEGKTITLAIELHKAAPPERPVATAPIVTERPPTRIEAAPRSRRRTYAVIAGAGGLAALATGFVFGSMASGTWDDAKALCGDDLVCDDPATLAQGNRLVDDAQSQANLSTALVIGGAALVGVGAVLWLTAPSASARTRSALRITPQAGPGRAGLVLGGRF